MHDIAIFFLISLSFIVSQKSLRATQLNIIAGYLICLVHKEKINFH